MAYLHCLPLLKIKKKKKKNMASECEHSSDPRNIIFDCDTFVCMKCGLVLLNYPPCTSPAFESAMPATQSLQRENGPETKLQKTRARYSSDALLLLERVCDRLQAPTDLWGETISVFQSRSAPVSALRARALVAAAFYVSSVGLDRSHKIKDICSWFLLTTKRSRSLFWKHTDNICKDVPQLADKGLRPSFHVVYSQHGARIKRAGITYAMFCQIVQSVYELQQYMTCHPHTLLGSVLFLYGCEARRRERGSPTVKPLSRAECADMMEVAFSTISKQVRRLRFALKPTNREEVGVGATLKRLFNRDTPTHILTVGGSSSGSRDLSARTEQSKGKRQKGGTEENNSSYYGLTITNESNFLRYRSL